MKIRRAVKLRMLDVLNKELLKYPWHSEVMEAIGFVEGLEVSDE